ncbi:tape measure protein [Pseudoflavonifractor hominis]|uniref:Tape measure protein n=1 Tax=Pseudoflavonifractor hominis TaxID=2763059 RepID=A0ABR7HUD3_9FIRM|nr:tape measure protein [Pseudoflavonifractor hominis]
MARIQEELILVDRFTAAFTSYLQCTGRAAEATELARRQANQYSEAQRQLSGTTDTLTGKIRNLVGAYAGLKGLTSLVGLSDTMAQTTARLNRMNGELKDTAQLNRMIYESAQRSRGSYQATADMVGKLGTMAGDAFNSTRELVSFAEQINKQIILSGASTQAADAALLQLTQAMSSGVLRGEELNSILEQTPTIAQSIAKYMGVSVGTMREMASEGQVTAEVVKNAMFDAAARINAEFAQMPMTWGQVWTSFQNTALMAFQPVLVGINWLANNLDIIGPLVLGAAGAFAVFQIAANWTKIAAVATAAYHFVVNLLSIGFGVLTGNTAAASAAVFTFNSALLASPITWIVMGVILLVAALYAGVAAFNHFTKSSISATGIVAGAFFTMGAQIMNMTIVPLQRGFAMFINFVGNAFTDLPGAVEILFHDMALGILGHIRSVASGIEALINAIPGVEVSLTSGIDSLYQTMQASRERAIAAGSYKEFVKPMEYFDLGKSFQSGYQWGSNLKLGGFSMPGMGDYGSGFTVPAYGELASINGKLGDISGSVGSIEKAVNLSEEDLKSLVDMAQRQYVNRINLTAQTPVITINSANTGRTAADRQQLADTIRDILIEQVAAGSTVSTARAY